MSTSPTNSTSVSRNSLISAPSLFVGLCIGGALAYTLFHTDVITQILHSEPVANNETDEATSTQSSIPLVIADTQSSTPTDPLAAPSATDPVAAVLLVVGSFHDLELAEAQEARLLLRGYQPTRSTRTSQDGRKVVDIRLGPYTVAEATQHQTVLAAHGFISSFAPVD